MKRQPSRRTDQTLQQLSLLSAAFLASVLFYGCLIAVLASGVSPLSATGQIFRPNPEPYPKLRDAQLKDALRKDWSRDHQPLSYLRARSAIWGSVDGNGRKASGAYTGAVIEYFKQSEEHTSELQSRPHLVCRLLLE